MPAVYRHVSGVSICLFIAAAAWFFGRLCPVVGGPVFAILLGMLISLFFQDRTKFQAGINFTSKKILQYAVILLGFGLNLSVVLKIGWRSLPIIVSTIAVALALAYPLCKALRIPEKVGALVGVGSAICGGSAIAATAPVIGAGDEDIAQAVSVIFFFNVVAAVLFPALGAVLGFSVSSGEAFGLFAGTAINDTSSVTAAAATWDSLHHLGSATLDMAVTVKLTRTLAIIPITLALAFYHSSRAGREGGGRKVEFKKIFPFFIFWFIIASLITTVLTGFGFSADLFVPFKTLSKFFIVMAMAAIGLNTNPVRLIKSGGKPLILGLCCWVSITGVSLLVQRMMGIW